MILNLIPIINAIYSSENYSLMELAYDSFRDEDLESIFANYLDTVINNANMDKQENNKRLQVVNLSLYIYKNLIPDNLLDDEIENMLSFSKSKIKEYKYSYSNSVKTYYNTANHRKFILKEYNSSSGNNAIKKFKNDKMNFIEAWANNSEYILSNFYYVQDLQYSQKKAILKYEGIYSLLSNINKEFIIEQIKERVVISNKIEEIHNADDVAYPSFIFLDGVISHNGVNNQSRLEFGNLKIVLPDDKTLNDKFNGAIFLGRFEIAVYGALLRIGSKTNFRNSQIRFTLPQIATMLDMSIGGRTYKLIYEAILNLSYKKHVYTYYDKVKTDWLTVTVSMLGAVKEPTFNSNSEKEYTVYMDVYVFEQIQLENVRILNEKKIFDFKHKHTSSLLAVFICDYESVMESNCDSKIYSLSELSERAMIIGKPSERQKKISMALDEIVTMNNKYIRAYGYTTDGDYCIVFKGRTQNGEIENSANEKIKIIKDNNETLLLK